jgi:hypothetical protein
MLNYTPQPNVKQDIGLGDVWVVAPAERAPADVDISGWTIERLLRYRMGRYSQLLAGYALEDPLTVIQAVSKIPPELLRDERARAVLTVLAEHRAELEAAPDPIALACDLAADTGYVTELARWMGDTCGVIYTAEHVYSQVYEIKQMAIAVNVIQDAQDEIGDERLDDLTFNIDLAIQRRNRHE